MFQTKDIFAPKKGFVCISLSSQFFDFYVIWQSKVRFFFTFRSVKILFSCFEALIVQIICFPIYVSLIKIYRWKDGENLRDLDIRIEKWAISSHGLECQFVIIHSGASIQI